MLFGLFSKKAEVPVAREENVHVVPVVECDCKAKQAEMLAEHDELNREIQNLKAQKKRAEDSLADSKRQLAEVEQQKKLEIENIKHMQKMLDEKNALKNERSIFDAQRDAHAEIKSIKDEYTSKLEKDLKEQLAKMDATYNKILEALPNVNVALGKTPTEE